MVIIKEKELSWLWQSIKKQSGFILSHPFTNFEIQKYYDVAHVVNLDEYKDTGGTHLVALFCKKKVKLFTLIVLVLNIYLKKLKSLLVIET